MGTNTFANNFEICSKSSSGKTIAAMPDPCFTPPPTPAGVEVVVPYPNTAMATDLDKGSTKVLICNKMAALEKKSCMKTSNGNEAAQASTMKGGVVTMTTKGKAYFTKWSQDVKFEGKGVCRHIDLTTHNHGSTPGHCVPMPFMSGIDLAGACNDNYNAIKESCTPNEVAKNAAGKPTLKIPQTPCANMENLPSSFFDNTQRGSIKKSGGSLAKGSMLPNEIAKFQTIAGALGIQGFEDVTKSDKAMKLIVESMESTVKGDPCLTAMRCALQSYKTTKNKKRKKSLGCCKGQSGHHIIPKSIEMPTCWPGEAAAPAVCVEGTTNTHGTHGKIHSILKKKLGEGQHMDCRKVLGVMSQSLHDALPQCSQKCIDAQLKEATGGKCPCGNKKQVFATPGTGGSPKQGQTIGKQ